MGPNVLGAVDYRCPSQQEGLRPSEFLWLLPLKVVHALLVDLMVGRCFLGHDLYKIKEKLSVGALNTLLSQLVMDILRYQVGVFDKNSET